jgi:DNA-binding GntR family transcriptional regulator
MSTEPLTKTEWVYERLRDRITGGELRPGERLRLERLAEEFATSAMPVREALRMLQRDGLVDIESHRGAAVADVTWERVYQTVLLRMHLEVLAAREAAPHHDDGSAERAAGLYERMEQLAERKQSARYSEANRRFHTALYEPCPHPLLRQEIQRLWDVVWQTRAQSLFHLDPGRMGHAQREHRRLLEAVKHRDPLAAERAAADHRDRTLAAWRRAIRDRTGPGSSP